MPSSQRSRDFLLPQGQPALKHVPFVFRFQGACPSRKPFRQNNATIFTDILAGFTFNNRVLRLPAIVLLNICDCCNSLSCKLLPQLVDDSGKKGFFFDRQLSYSCLSHSSSVLAANDCRLLLTFLQRSPSFSLASASRVQHDNESWHAGQPAYLTNTYNLNSYDSQTRAWADVFTQKRS